MRKIILLLVFLMGIVISGCAAEQGNTGGYERPSGGYHGGHH
ncbi:MAG: hypothetical protein WC628_08330 [Candidatus Omnitrophota bacterium]